MLDCSGRASFPDGLPLAHNIRMITVIYFARLREALGKSSEQLALPAGVRDLAGLRQVLIARGGAWAVELAGSKPVRAAVNQDMAQNDTRVADGDEIAFFPPVTGG
jgi:molybdopterin synthase sulfur carrier subunit